MVESDVEALGHYGLTMALLDDHDTHEFEQDTHEFTMTLMNWLLLVNHDPYELTMTLMSWPRPSWIHHEPYDLIVIIVKHGI